MVRDSSVELTLSTDKLSRLKLLEFNPPTDVMTSLFVPDSVDSVIFSPADMLFSRLVEIFAQDRFDILIFSAA